jgi:endonuclease YncB( thermonuclease family)
MADAFFSIDRRPRAITGIRKGPNGQPQSLEATIPDGDTLGVHVEGSGSVRFLGIDTPEKTFELPTASGSRRLDSSEWENYLSDPFSPQHGAFDLEAPLLNHLKGRVGAGAASNHRQHGENAEDALTGLVQSDMTALGQDLSSFRYFLAFAFEVFDAYGRMLAYINRNQPSANSPSPRPLSYNERMLQLGAALPYFIWPNIDPFRESSLLEAVFAPGTAHTVAQATPALRRARDAVKSARTAGSGVFNPANPLRFEAFEIRFLGRREAPNRAVIDLSRNDDVLLRPQSYFRIPHPEDRLFIPPAFVPLFVARGWRLEGWT